LAELDAVREGKCFLAAATLRAETMYGQTNFWVLPDGDYGAYQMTDGEVKSTPTQCKRHKGPTNSPTHNRPATRTLQ
jgi:leucyl-tRNA synthetase